MAMTGAQAQSDWRVLRRGESLAEVRLECHHAVQLNTRLARGFVAHRSDDSHTSLRWDGEALRGEAAPTPAGDVTLSLRIADLTFLVNDGTAGRLPLSGRTGSEPREWLARILSQRGVDPGPLEHPLHFELARHPLLHGARFSVAGREAQFRRLADYYHNASLVLGAIAGGSPVRCWPHHFDIATLLPEGTGAGLSPGDQTYTEPYFYVTPWPYPAAEKLPRLEVGFWHTDAWTGAVLPSDSIESAGSAEGQRRIVERFIEGALRALSTS